MSPLQKRKTEQWAWLNGGDTGSSSLAIFHHMTGTMPRAYLYADYPLDPSDFGRCYRLLKRFPGWRRRICEMREHGAAWKRLVAQWAEMEALYERDLPTGSSADLYDLMSKLIYGRRKTA